MPWSGRSSSSWHPYVCAPADLWRACRAELGLTSGRTGTNAFAFMTVARLVYYVLPDQSLLRVKATTLTKLLVWFDVACFLVQATGGILMSNDDPGASLIRTGQYIYMGGCGAQLAFILVFCAMMGRFTTKIERDSRPILNMAQVRMLVWALYAVLSFIVVSCRSSFFPLLSCAFPLPLTCSS